MKMNQQVSTSMGVGRIVVIEKSKSGIKYGVKHAIFTVAIQRNATKDDIFYFEEKEMEIIK